jgi:hypothetical protein
MTTRPTRKSNASPATHPLQPETRVTVFQLALARRPFIEGRPVIVRAVPSTPDLYVVRFPGGRRTRQRFVHPEFQAKPDRVLARMLSEWRASLDPSLLTEFDFPNEEDNS